MSTICYPQYHETDLWMHKYLTKLNISVQYYTFELGKESQELCVKSHHLTITNINTTHEPKMCPWFCSTNYGLWIKSYMGSIIKTYTLTTLVSFVIFGRNIKFSLTKFYLAFKQFALPLTLSKCMRYPRNQLARFWFIPAGLKPWKKCISAILEQKPPHNIKVCAVSLVLSTKIWSCGLNGHFC